MGSRSEDGRMQKCFMARLHFPPASTQSSIIKCGQHGELLGGFYHHLHVTDKDTEIKAINSLWRKRHSFVPSETEYQARKGIKSKLPGCPAVHM